MRPDIVLRKTPRGLQELQTREHRLSTLARRLLVLVDGQHDVVQLATDLALDPHDSVFDAAARELLDGAYVWQVDERDPDPGAGGAGSGWHALR